MTEARVYPPAVRRWLEIAAARDPAGHDELLANEVVFVSPVFHTPPRGKTIAKAYLSAALEVLGGENFRYVGFWRADTSAVLEFATIIDGIDVNGVDIIGCNADDRIVSFKVMKPLKRIEILRAKMAERLEAMRRG